MSVQQPPKRVVLDARKMKYINYPIVPVAVDATKQLRRIFFNHYMSGKLRLPINDDLHLVVDSKNLKRLDNILDK